MRPWRSATASRSRPIFAALDAANGPVLDQLEALGRRHLVEEPRERAILCIQIWAEAARNPAMARMCAAIDGTVVGGLAEAIAGAKANGELPADLDEARFLQAIFMMADGFLPARHRSRLRRRRGGRHLVRRDARPRPRAAPFRCGRRIMSAAASHRPTAPVQQELSRMSARLARIAALSLLVAGLAPAQAQTPAPAAAPSAGPSVTVTKAGLSPRSCRASSSRAR